MTCSFVEGSTQWHARAPKSGVISATERMAAHWSMTHMGLFITRQIGARGAQGIGMVVGGRGGPNRSC